MVKGMVLAGTAALLVGCGGGDDPPASSTTTTSTTTTTEGDTTALESGDASSLVTTNPPHSIVLSYPHANAIFDTEQGVYRRTVVAMVTDQEGRPVADGTPVYLSLIDTVLAQGTLESPADSASGSTLADSDPTAGDVSTVDPHGNPWQFDSIFVVRNNAHRFIEPGDLLLLGTGVGTAGELALDAPVAEAEDKYRLISAVGSGSLTVDSAYQNVYPTATSGVPFYQSGEISYVVGASLAGAQVAGVSQAATTGATTTADTGTGGLEDPAADLGTNTTGGELTSGVAVTVDGVAVFNISYPSSVESLYYGCALPELETRVEPPESAQLHLIARVNDEVVTVADGFCFEPIDEGEIALMIDQVTLRSYDTGVIEFQLFDGGNRVPVPFYPVAVTVVPNPDNGSAFAVTASDPASPVPNYVFTDESGIGRVTVEVLHATPEDSAQVVFHALSAEAEATVTIVRSSAIRLATHSIVTTAGTTTHTVNFTVESEGVVQALPAWAITAEVNTTGVTGSIVIVNVVDITVDSATGQGTMTIEVANAQAGDAATITLSALGSTSSELRINVQ